MPGHHQGLADGSAPGATPPAGGVPTAGRVPGVPHNLGVSDAGAAPASGTERPPAPSNGGADRGAGAPYRATPPAAPPRGAQPTATASHHTGGSDAKNRADGRRPRPADRVITIILLVLGAFGALNIASSFLSIESQLHLTGAAVGVEDPTIAPWVTTLGTVSGIAVLLLYAVTLIFSIQRLRARKLTFWVPLTAGVISVIIMIVIPMIGFAAGAPEIMQQLEADPSGSLDSMMEYLQGMQP